jgi:hypothetical protein
MKRIIVALLVVAVAGSFAFAGDNAKPITKAGNAALLFDLGGLANLSAGNYEGGFGAKYYLSNDLALRLGLGFTSSSQTTKNPTTGTLPPTILSESKLTSMSFSVAPGVQFNIAKTNAVVAYVGGLVSFTTSSTKREGNSVGFNTGFTSGAEYKESNSIFGVAAFVGAEWFAWDNISFSAEYRFGFSSTTGKVESTVPAPGVSTSTDSPSTTSFGISSGNAANLTLAIYI